MGKSGVIAVVAICAAVVAVAAIRSGGADAASATATTFSRTFDGDDFRPLDVRIGTEHADNTGGAVVVQLVNDGSNTYPSVVYLEARADLPIGARVSSVTFYYLDCGHDTGSTALASAYLGYYAPATRGFTYIRPATHDKLTCDWAATVMSGSPLATVVGGRRYTLGVAVSGEAVRTEVPPVATGPYFLGGATLRFTCPTTCG